MPARPESSGTAPGSRPGATASPGGAGRSGGRRLDKSRQSRCPADEDHQEPGREGIERAGVADIASAELPAYDRDDIVRRPSGRLVNEQPTDQGVSSSRLISASS